MGSLCTRAVAIVVLLLATGALAGPCDSPWAIDYRYQPGFSEFGVQGRTLDLALYPSGQCVLVVGEDEDGSWVRSYQVQPPALVELVDERRDFESPTAIEFADGHAYLLDGNALRVLRLGGAGMMYEVGATPLEGMPVCLALDGDRAWAGEGALLSEIDVGDPESPVVLRTVATPLVGTIGNPARLRAHAGEAWVIGPDNDILYVDGRGASLVAQSVAPSAYIYATVVDIGWLDDGRRAIAWRNTNGLGYRAGSIQFCEADDRFLRIPMDESAGTGCGSSVPTTGDLPTPVQLSGTSRGLVYTSTAGGPFAADAEWQLYTPGSFPSPPVSGELWQPTYEVGWLGETLVGRADAGIIIHGPGGPAPDPVLSIIEYVEPYDGGPTIAQNGFTVALSVPDGIRLVDASDPTAPVVAGLIAGATPRWLKFVEGDPHLYGSRGSEVVAWDISDLFAPVEVGVRGFGPGSVRLAAWNGGTAIFASATGSTTIEAWSPPGAEPALLASWDLTEPLEFHSVEGGVVGGPYAWLGLDWPGPIVPRRTLADASDPDWPWRWTGAPLVGGYTDSVAYTQGMGQRVATIELGDAPADHFEQVHSRFDRDFFVMADTHGDALWTAQAKGVTVGWGTGVDAGSVDAFVTDFGEYFGFWWSQGIEIGDRFTAIATDSRLFLLAPNCREPNPPVPIVVRSFDVESGADGCARIWYVVAGGHDLGLYRIAGGRAQQLPASIAEPDLWLAQDCPDGPVIYQLRDGDGVVFATKSYSFTPAPDSRTRLLGVRPNPFNPQTEIRFTIGQSGPVTLTIVDNRGRRVRTICDGWREAGIAAEIWDGRDQGGARVAAGVYFVSLRTSDGRDLAKLALVK